MENFWQAHDYILQTYLDEGNHVTAAEVRTYCEDVLQLEMTQFDADIADPYTYSYLSWDKAQGQAAGVTGTPSVFVCGEKISWGDLESVIDGYLN
jgi:protein-disulfide isomerase